jgi:thiosulfate reductase cytochrome b subunit
MHPLPVRIWHWTNAIGFVLLILTGLQIRYADAVAVMGFKTAVNLHNTVGLVLVINYFVWLAFYLFSDKIVVYHPELSPSKYFRHALSQIAYYGYGIFKGQPNPHHGTEYRKFNALQSITYQIIMILLVPIQFYTGVVLWDLNRFAGALRFLRRVHFRARLPGDTRTHRGRAPQGHVDRLRGRRRNGEREITRFTRPNSMNPAASRGCDPSPQCPRFFPLRAPGFRISS